MAMRAVLGRIVARGVCGGVSGFVAYALLLAFRGPWRHVIAALLIGAAAGLLARRRSAIAIGALSAATGWTAGTLLFGLWMDLGIGAWMIGGLGLGLAFGLVSGSWQRAVAGAALGFLAGVAAEASRYLPVFVEPLRLADVDLLVLLCAGVLFSTMAAAPLKPDHEA